MIKPLTKKQKEILDFIKIYSELHGYAPSLEEIKNHFQLAAISTVHEHIENLKRKGYILKEINQARSIRTTDNKSQAEGILEIPLIAKFTAESRLEETKGQTVSIFKRAEFAHKELFSILLETESYSSSGFLPGDFLIFSRESESDTSEQLIYLTENKKDLAALRKGNLLTKDEEIKGMLVMLVRNFL